ncbi:MULTISPECIES: glutathione synthetase [unclassified Streptomyces]|uniref:Glutathione synthetase n=1 Tax=Streptomyces sp. NBC_00060 TaxID=2975636 RepID=A0AAU2GST3_9ACTN
MILSPTRTSATGPDAPTAAGVAAVIAPADTGTPYAPALARHGWSCIPVTLPGTLQAGAAPSRLINQITHTGSLRRTARDLAHAGTTAVVAGSPAGCELADRLAARLGLPGNAPATADLRRDTAWTSATLRDAGLSAPRLIRTASLGEALRWTRFTRLPQLVVEHPDPARTHPGALCRTPADIRAAWHRQQHRDSQPLVLREHHPGTQFRIHTMSGPSHDGNDAHTVTAIWCESHTRERQIDRADLVSRRGILARALTRYTQRALTILGVRYGPAQVTVVYTPDRGPTLTALRTDAGTEFAPEALRAATGHDPVADTVHLILTGRREEARPVRQAHTTKVALLPRQDGVVNPELLHTLTSLPTVAAHTPLIAGTAVSAGQVAGWFLLAAEDMRAINRDYQAIRAAEDFGLYGRTA